jgi:Uma2 family endonuclease
MASPQRQPIYTVDEYLALERSAEERHEFLDGRIYAMAGETGAHGDICVNLVITLGNQLKGTHCRARTKGTKVRSGPDPKPRQGASGMFSYPDVVVICGEPEYHDAYTDVVLTPTAVMEVLSPATEAFDRGEKFTRFQAWNATLTDYLLVSQDQPQIEHYSRRADGGWSYHRYPGRESSVTIPSIQCTLRLMDVYDRVAFRQE